MNQAETSSSKREKVPEKAAKDRRGESSTAEVAACSSDSVQREVPDHPRANTSVQERKVHNTRNMVQRAEPHTAVQQPTLIVFVGDIGNPQRIQRSSCSS